MKSTNMISNTGSWTINYIYPKRLPLNNFTEYSAEPEVYKAKLKAKDEKISVAEEQIRINTLLLESGKIIPSELTKSEAELKLLRAERKSLKTEV